MKNLIFNKTNIIYFLLLTTFVTANSIALSKYKVEKEKEITQDSSFSDIKPIEAVDIETLTSHEDVNNILVK